MTLLAFRNAAQNITDVSISIFESRDFMLGGGLLGGSVHLEVQSDFLKFIFTLRYAFPDHV